MAASQSIHTPSPSRTCTSKPASPAGPASAPVQLSAIAAGATAGNGVMLDAGSSQSVFCQSGSFSMPEPGSATAVPPAAGMRAMTATS